MQARRGFRELDGIGVQTEQVSAGLQTGEDCLGMAAVAERAVHRDVAGLRGQGGEDFCHHDRTMRAGGSLTGCNDFRNGGGITRRIVFLVLLYETSRNLPAISRAAASRGGGLGHSASERKQLAAQSLTG